jgi:glyoxylate/hydroxypyruvate reductase A
LQNEADIQAALERGLLSAASLDVFETEPLPEASPLWGNPKITITPHAAASSSANALTPEIVKMITDYERDGTLTNLVDREKQY